ncbi:hypothetical protein, partial [Actinoplanes philippinensis]|uniref:hypothetical protein n=1 Tax=Actinoplanes philippinensis TaxID=35752 RepID=UPI0033E47B97
MNTWDTHLATHARLAASRRSTAAELRREPAHQHALDTLAHRQAQLTALAETVTTQETQIHQTAAALRTPVTVTGLHHGPAAPPLPWDQAVTDLHTHLTAAHDAAADVYRLGHQAPLLPTLRQTTRTILIFLLCSVPMLILNAATVVYVLDDATRRATTDGAPTSWNGMLLLCSGILLPLLTTALATLTTLTLGRPRLATTTSLLPGLAIGALLTLLLSVGSL